MDLKGTQLQQTFGNLVTVGTSAGTPTLGQIENGNGDPLTQVTLGLGSVGAPSYSFTGDVNTGLFASGADAIGLVTGGTSRLAIDSSGNVEIGANVGIGGTATAKLDVHHADEDGLRFTTADGAQTFIDFGDASDNNIGSIRYDHADNHMRFLTNNAERIRMFSDGDISFMSVSQNRDFYWDAGNSRLGIGTTSPSEKLHIIDSSNPGNTSGSVIIEGRRDGVANTLTLRAKDASAPTSALPNGQGSVLRWQGFDGTDFENMGYILVSADGQAVANGDAPSFMAFGTSADGSSNPTERMRIDSSGNVGIGTDSPSQRLEVHDASSTTTAKDGGVGIAIKNTNSTDNNQASLEFQNSNGTKSASIIATFTDHSTNEAELSFCTGPDGGGTFTEAMRIDKNGRLGIGTNSPGTILDVQKSDSSTVMTRLWNTNTSGNGASVLRIANNGNNNNGNRIEFSDANYYMGTISADRTQGILFRTSATGSNPITIPERMRISPSGNVGIGTTSPSSLLHVNTTSTSNFGLKLSRNDSATDGFEFTYTPSSALAFIDAKYPSSSGQAYGDIVFRTNNGGTQTERLRIKADGGGVNIVGALSKGSGSFKIDHPLESKKDTHHLVHSFVESPQANNIYRGFVTLSDGQATVNLDEVSGMTDGTFVLLNTDIHVYTSNESDWDAVKGSVSDNVLTIECQNSSSTAKVNWLVIGERHDQHMIDTDWTDENGKVIVEPLK